MNKDKLWACLTYLLSIPGCLYVLLFQRRNELAVYHAKQSLGLALVALGALAIWLLGSWILSWVPLVGPLIAAAMFSQVLLAFVFAIVAGIMGTIYALRAKMEALPFVGRWAERIPV